MAKFFQRSFQRINAIDQIRLHPPCYSHLYRRCCFCASMLPTMNISGDVVLVDRISHRFSKIVPGDIVIIVSPENLRKVVTKRFIAVEQNTVTYLVDPKNSEKHKTVEVPKGHLWVQGDNIYASRDSRDFGPVPYGLLHGKVFWRIWPIKYFGPL